jgi:hypothetical protein
MDNSNRQDARPDGPQLQVPQAHHARRRWAPAVIGVAQLMIALDSTIMNIALPSAQRDLGFTSGDRQWIVTACALALPSRS